MLWKILIPILSAIIATITSFILLKFFPNVTYEEKNVKVNKKYKFNKICKLWYFTIKCVNFRKWLFYATKVLMKIKKRNGY